MNRIHSFEPLIDSNSRILILGSIPGKESLRKNQYYGYSQNWFWKVVYSLYDCPYCDDYEERLLFLTKHRLSLWDVIESCERDGSSDSNIRNVVCNDFISFFKNHPQIIHVYFNGKTSYRLFETNFGFNFKGISLLCLSSTSPAHAISFQKRLSDWKAILS